MLFEKRQCDMCEMCCDRDGVVCGSLTLGPTSVARTWTGRGRATGHLAATFPNSKPLVKCRFVEDCKTHSLKVFKLGKGSFKKN